MTPWGISAKWFNVVVHRTRRLCKRWWPASKWIFFRCCCAAVAPVFEVSASIKFSPVRGAALNHGNPQHTLIKNSVLESRFSFSCLHYTHINRPTGGQSTLWVTQSLGGEKCGVDLIKREKKNTSQQWLLSDGWKILLIEWHFSSFFGSLLSFFFLAREFSTYNYSLLHSDTEMNLCPAMKISSH